MYVLKRVSIVKCHSYDYEIVEQKVFECLDNIEGLKDKIKEGNKVLVKTNLFKKISPMML